jgi:Flp pilus assembly pilin Flp
MKDKLLSLYVAIDLKAQSIGQRARKTISNEEGASMVEYALVLGVIVVAVIGAAGAMIPELKTFFLKVVKTITDLVG